MIYLDHNATTPVLEEVIEAMLPWLRQGFGNPSSDHPVGRAARAAIDAAREEVGSLIGAPGSTIVFTGGGTESSNLAIRGLCAAVDSRRHIVTSAVEHPATIRPCARMERSGWRVSTIGVDATGAVDVEAAAAAMSADTVLVTVMHANNEVGTIQPLSALSHHARRVGAFVHTDAAQSLGKVPVDVDALGVDLLTLAGHKLYAPKGVGALYVRPNTPLKPIIDGAGHERGLRPGTENVPYVVGLGVACRIAARDLATEAARVEGLRERLHARLRERVPGLRLSGHPTARLPNTLNVRFPGVSGRSVLAGAPRVAASTGSACHEHGETASAVQRALGLTESEALGAVRLSLGRHTTVDEVERAADALVKAWEELS